MALKISFGLQLLQLEPLPQNQYLGIFPTYQAQAETQGADLDIWHHMWQMWGGAPDNNVIQRQSRKQIQMLKVCRKI